MKNQKWMKRLGAFVLDKGFYIALFLFVTAIGISGYYLYRNWNVDPTGSASVQLPDDGPDRSQQPQPPTDTQRPTPKPVLPDASPLPDVSAPPQTQTPPQPQPAQPPAPAIYVWPVEGELLRPFSVETLSLDPTLADWRTPAGVDILAAEGERVLAMTAGTVSEVYEDGLMGTTVVIDHGEGLSSLYASLSPETLVKPGDSVQSGDPIGAVGISALAEQAMQPHLHLEVWHSGQAEDPARYLPEAK